MKRICISVFLFFLSLMAFCQSDEDILNSNIDDLFSEVDDIEVPVIEEKPAPAGFQSVPLTFSGSLTTDLGIGYIWNKESSNKKNLMNAHKLASSVICLPMFADLKDTDIIRIVDVLKL